MPLDTFVDKKGIKLQDLTGESWVISSQAEHEIKKQVEKMGTPLKEWDIAINYGIKTGFNEAFIIDGKKRNELIEQDPESAEIIKPILRGRDIKRFRIDFADLWLINTHNSYGKTPPIDPNKYPAIKRHLDQYLSKLRKRQDKGVTLYNLRNCAYLEEFEKEKVVWADLSRSGNSFAFDRDRYYPLNTAYFLTGSSLKYLLAVLNSQIILFYLDLINQKLDKNGWRWIHQYVEKLPIPKILKNLQKPSEALVGYISLLLRREFNLQSAYFEQIIDGLVYEVYFPHEIKTAGKEILPHLGKLTPLTDTMSEEEKLAVIHREFDRLYDPRHPVRNHIETLDSVEVVKIVRNALKR